jgi:hypothetical protein
MKLYDAIEEEPFDTILKMFKELPDQMNTLIPVNMNRRPVAKHPLTKESKDRNIVDIVPLLIPLFHVIKTNTQRKAILKAFLKKKGDIHLESSGKKHTIYTEAVRIKDKSLQALLEPKVPNFASYVLLTSQQPALCSQH